VFVLAIDTSTPAVTAGVVVVAGNVAGGAVQPAAERTALAARGHGELLSPAIADCLNDVGIEAAELAAVVVGTGPGPYTGLRVGLVTAATFADALDVPMYEVCSLDALGASCADEAALLVATDARRHEVYWARYEYGRRVGEPAVARPAEIALDGLTAVAGAGGELYLDVWPQLRRRPERYPDPLSLVRLAVDRIDSGAESEPPKPLYLRRPDAVVPGAPKTVTQ
jgi:tRNA threonylcarbamoyl adenosine modification protein YeaZ